jgi:Rrf2 family transcriptional regulator, iron-sulfur cluster assembly transcription factor
MRISTKVRYAVMAMVDIAIQDPKTPVSLAAIAQRQELPLPYLEQLFNKLKKAGLVQSCRGSSGGYQLGRCADQTLILDILNAVDKPIKATRCGNHPEKGCHRHQGRCLTHDLWESLDRMVHTFLQNVSLADICQRRVSHLTHVAFLSPEKSLERSPCSAAI